MSEPQQEIQPWWRNRRFPLVPIWETRDADEYNTFHWSLNWLFISYWSLDAFAFEVSLSVSPGFIQGISVGVILPYTRLVFYLPVPLRCFEFLHRHPRGWR